MNRVVFDAPPETGDEMNGEARSAGGASTDGTDRIVVTAAEFVRQFGNLRQLAGNAPVFVTHHGRETHVLLSTSQYSDSIAVDSADGKADHGSPLPSLEEFAGWIPQAVLSLDERLTIVLANRAAHALMDRSDGNLVGRNLYEAVPEMNGSLVQTYLNRAVSGKEAYAADLPSIFRADTWIRLEVYPLSRNTTVVFRDITADVVGDRLADTKKAIAEAVESHRTIGCIRLNTRGQIERVDASISRLLLLQEERLKHVAVADLVPVAARVAFRAALDSVLRGDGPLTLETTFLANDGSQIAIDGALAELRGIYGNEGAVLVVTER